MFLLELLGTSLFPDLFQSLKATRSPQLVATPSIFKTNDHAMSPP